MLHADTLGARKTQGYRVLQNVLQEANMSKPLVGHHLLRVRIRKNIFLRLQEVAEEESIRTDDYVTVSDLVRQACVTLLNMHDQLAKLNHIPGESNSELDPTADVDDDEDAEDFESASEPFSVNVLKS
jgi:hypothetical protein